MREISFSNALNEAILEEMRRDESVIVLGEDVGYFGGPFHITNGCFEEFGQMRAMDTPISETAIIGASVGAAVTGLRPIPEIMYVDFIGVCTEQIINQAAKRAYVFGAKVPIVLRVTEGAGWRSGPHHSQTLHSMFMNIPGLKLVLPSTPYNAKGLLKSSIRDDNPVIFFENRVLYDRKGGVPEEEYLVPLGEADVKREGDDVTIIATQVMVHEALKAAEELENKGTSVEVIDPRTIIPLDKDTIVNSVKKTGRVLIADESCVTGSAQSEIAAVLAEEAFFSLEAPIKRIGVPDVPIPFSPVLEDAILPTKDTMVKEIEALLS